MDVLPGHEHPDPHVEILQVRQPQVVGAGRLVGLPADHRGGRADRVVVEEEEPQPCPPGEIGEAQRQGEVVEGLRRETRLVHRPRHPEDEPDIGMRVEEADLPPQAPGECPIVGIEDREEASPRPRHGGVHRRRDAPVLEVTFEADARIGEATQDLCGAVGRAVVGDDDLEILEGLGEHALDRLSDIGRVLVGFHQHRDGGGRPRRRRQEGRQRGGIGPPQALLLPPERADGEGFRLGASEVEALALHLVPEGAQALAPPEIVLAEALLAVGAAEPFRLDRLPRRVPLEAEMLVVPELQGVAWGQDEVALGRRRVASRPEAGLAQGLRLEHAELVEGDARTPPRDALHEEPIVVGHAFVVQVESQRRDQGDAPVGHLREVIRHGAAGDVQVLVDGRHDDPVRPVAAFLPGLVLHRPVRQHEGVGIRAGEVAQLDLRVGAQDLAGAVRRAVVVDHVAVDEGIVVAEEEAEHVGLVPAQGVEMDDGPRHGTAIPL